MKKELKEWQKVQAPTKVEISEEGLTKALLEAHEAEEIKKFDKEVIVWFHLVAMAIGPRAAFPNIPMPKRRLFEVMNNETNRSLFKRGMKKFATDEVPTDFMRNLYREFLAWQEKNPRKNKE